MVTLGTFARLGDSGQPFSQRGPNPFPLFCGGTFTAIACGSFAILMGAIASDSLWTATTLVGFGMALQMLFSGLAVPMTSIPPWLAWMQYLTGFKQGVNLVLRPEVEGLLSRVEELDLVPALELPGSSGGTTGAGVPALKNPLVGHLYRQVAALFDLGEGEYQWAIDVGVLLAVFFVYRCAAMCVLVWRSRYPIY